MDECLGQFISLWPFCEILTNRLPAHQRPIYLSNVARRLEESEQHWLFRPGIDKVLEMLVSAQKTHKIFGCFILSNNGSQKLVDCVRMILNIRAKRFGSNQLFFAGWSRNSPCRKGDMKKSLEEIQYCLEYEGLPNAQRLLFFDDITHVLTSQIHTNYIQVSPYIFYTPVDLLYHILTPVFKRMEITPSLLQSISQRSKLMETRDLKEESYNLSSPPPSKWVEAEKAISHFVRTSLKSIQRHKTLKSSSKSSKQLRTQTAKSTKTKTKSRLWLRY